MFWRTNARSGKYNNIWHFLCNECLGFLMWLFFLPHFHNLFDFLLLFPPKYQSVTTIYKDFMQRHIFIMKTRCLNLLNIWHDPNAFQQSILIVTNMNYFVQTPDQRERGRERVRERCSINTRYIYERIYETGNKAFGK